LGDSFSKTFFTNCKNSPQEKEENHSYGGTPTPSKWTRQGTLPWGSGARAYVYFLFTHPQVDVEAMSREHPPHQNQTAAALITYKNANSHDALIA